MQGRPPPTCTNCIAPLPVQRADDGVVTCPYCGAPNRVGSSRAGLAAEAAARAPARPNAMGRAIALAVGLAIVAWLARHFLLG